MSKLTEPQKRALSEIGQHLAAGHRVARRYSDAAGSEYTYIRARFDVVERLREGGYIGLDPAIPITNVSRGSRRDVYFTDLGGETLAELYRAGGQS